MSINRVEIGGNLGHDPELRATASGLQVCRLSLCVNDRQKKDGQWVDKPNLVDVVFFGNRAESISKYLRKGSTVFIAGRLSERKWEAKDGSKRSKIEVIGEDIQFAGGNGGQQTQQQAEPQPDLYDEEIPF